MAAYRAGGQRVRQSNYPQKPNFQPPSDDEIKSIIIKGDVDKLVNLADRVGEKLVIERLTTNQIRNVYGTVRQIQMRWASDADKSYRDAILLRPKLAYYATREKQKRGSGMEILELVLEPALKLVGQEGISDSERQKRFGYFTDLFEAIVAYHKKHGGQDK